MAFFILLSLVAIALSVGTIRTLFNDGRGPQAPPVSHLQDPRFGSPASSAWRC